MKKNILIFSALLLLYGNANAEVQTIEGLVNHLFSTGQISTIAKLLQACAYLGGIGLGIKSILKFYEWNESKGRNVKITTPIIFLVCSGLLLGLPAVIEIGTESFFGSSA